MTGVTVCNGCWALLPAKPFHRAKTRLAGVLTPSERAALAEAMFCDVLATLAAVDGLAGIVVVSNDEAVGASARRSGALQIDEPGEGLNAALWHGLQWLCARRAEAVLVTPGDIPFASVGEFQAAVSALRANPVVMAPARRDGGTNLLGIAPPQRILPRFGKDSFARHRQAARQAGMEPLTLLLAGAGLDIDVPADLSFDPSVSAGRNTRAFLDRLVGGRRSARTGILEHGALQ